MKKFGEQNYGLSSQRISEDIISLLNAKEAEHIDAEAWNKLIPEVADLLSLSEEDLYERIESGQARISKKVNFMAEIADLARSRRHKCTQRKIEDEGDK